MSYRTIHTSIWKDSFFLDLEPNEKLIFIYLFSNDLANVAGIYKIPVRVIAFETEIDLDYVNDTLHKFEQHGKIRYRYGILWVVNMRKYNAAQSPKVAIAIERCLADIPECDLKAEYTRYYDPEIPYREPEIPYPYPTDTLSLINTNISEVKTNINNNKTIKEVVGVVYKNYEANIGLLTPIISDKLDALISDFPAEWIIEAIGIATQNEKRNLAYITGILKRWSHAGKSDKRNGKAAQAERDYSVGEYAEYIDRD